MARMRASLLLLPVLLFGCSNFPTYAENTAETMDTVTQEAIFLSAAMDSMTPSTTPTEAAQNAASRAGEFFEGEGCVETDLDGSAVTYTLTACDGAFGLTGITGSVTTTYRMTSMGLGFDMVSTGLTIGEREARFTLAGEIAQDVRSVSVTTMSEMVGPRSILVARDGDYIMRYNPSSGCVAITGTFTSTIEGIAWETTSTEYQRCPNGCAAMGSSVTMTSSEGSLTMTFDGSATGLWTAGDDGNGEATLLCTP